MVAKAKRLGTASVSASVIHLVPNVCLFAGAFGWHKETWQARSPERRSLGRATDDARPCHGSALSRRCPPALRKSRRRRSRITFVNMAV